MPGPGHVGVGGQLARWDLDPHVPGGVAGSLEVVEKGPLRLGHSIDDPVEHVGGVTGPESIAFAGTVPAPFVEPERVARQARDTNGLAASQALLDASRQHVGTVGEIEDASEPAQSALPTCARAIASALMLTIPRTDVVWVSTCTEQAAPTRIGPTATPPPSIFSRL